MTNGEKITTQQALNKKFALSTVEHLMVRLKRFCVLQVKRVCYVWGCKLT